MLMETGYQGRFTIDLFAQIDSLHSTLHVGVFDERIEEIGGLDQRQSPVPQWGD